MRSNGNEAEPAQTPDASSSLPSATNGKASFDDIYDQPDPRAYYRTLRPHEYQIPHHAQQLIRRLLGTKELVAAAEHSPPCVLDVCCSYGLNAALLNHTLCLEDLYRHYEQHDRAEPGPRPDTDALVALDRAYYAEHRRHDAVRTLGLDAAANAVTYARRAGLLEEGFAEDLERHEPSPQLRRALADVSLITVSGGVGYVTARTFGRLVQQLERPVWMLALVLRTVGYQEISRTLAQHGMTTVRAEGISFPQRRFTTADEQRHALEAVRAAGLSPDGREETGYYHADLYLSGPADQAAVTEVLAEILDR